MENKKVQFYPDIKKWISPSAFAAWHKNKPQFVRSYFMGVKSPETAAMKGGKKIHALIEGGLLEAKNRFDRHEDTIEVALAGSSVSVLGIPDSYEVAEKDTVSFVDYKSGKENVWTQEKLATDLKTLLTAWLVLQANPAAKNVQAIIEYIPTEWDDKEKEIKPTGGEHVICSHTFMWNDLFKVPELIKSTVEQVNIAYEQYLETKDSDINFVSDEDVVGYAKLDAEKKGIDIKMKEIKDRISEQMTFANKQNYEHELGSFYFTTRKVYKHPEDLEAQTKSGNVVSFAYAEEVALAMSVAMKNWELTAEPATISKSLQFRAKKKK